MGAPKIKKSAKAKREPDDPKPPKAKSAKSKEAKRKRDVKLTRKTMVDLYEAKPYLRLGTQTETGLRIPVELYFKDPAVAKTYAEIGIDDEFTTPWEPGLRDGPTSARFAVVDFDSTSNTLTPPAVWDRKKNCYRAPDGTPLDRKAIKLFQFHQLSVWATVQNTLDYFESGFGLGRRITWAFEGNRLIVLPHAGYGENAYYDRASKSLQFYYFNGPSTTVYTCLSSDIVNHEFGHAVLDGLRPHYYESVTGEAAAFHEFLGDLTAILMAFRNNRFRRLVLKKSKGILENDTLLANLAPEFGEAVTGDAYLRSALNSETMKSLADNLEPHALSEVLTGAMFDLLKGIYTKRRTKDETEYAAGRKKNKPSEVDALAKTVPRMQTMAIQPLDLLPPCSVTFADYARAVLRSEQVANPTDPEGYRAMMLEIFVKRGILSEDESKKLLEPTPVFERPALDVVHPIEAIAASRGGAYRFLDDNRDKLLIPQNADLVVSELVRARKRALDGRLLPDQIVVQYIWREEVLLDDERFGLFAGQRTSMLCGATMVLDENGNLIHWSRKPGRATLGQRQNQIEEQLAGEGRRKELLDAIAARVAAGTIGESIGGELGIIERASPPVGVRKEDGVLRFELAPHFSISGSSQDPDAGDRRWQISF
jgi:hypothetical protein